jgi:hypothetical protein
VGDIYGSNILQDINALNTFCFTSVSYPAVEGWEDIYGSNILQDINALNTFGFTSVSYPAVERGGTIFMAAILVWAQQCA